MIKKVIIFVLTLCLVLSFAFSCFAAEETSAETTPLSFPSNLLDSNWKFRETLSGFVPDLSTTTFNVSFSAGGQSFTEIRFERYFGGGGHQVLYFDSVRICDVHYGDNFQFIDATTDNRAQFPLLEFTEGDTQNPSLISALSFYYAEVVPPPNADFLETASTVITGLLSFFGTLLVSLFTPDGVLFLVGSVFAVPVAIFVIYLVVRLWRRLN